MASTTATTASDAPAASASASAGGESTTSTLITSTLANAMQAVVSRAGVTPSEVISGTGSTAATSSSLLSSSATTTASSTTARMLNVADVSSSLQHFGVVDYLVFVLMLVACAIIGVYFGFVEKKQKKKRNTEQRRGSEALDYLVGGRKMKVFPVSLSLVASFVSGISLLGTSTEIYVYGTQYAFILITLAISGVISWYVFLPVFCNLQLTSTYEYFEKRFDRRVRLFGSLLFTSLMFLWMPISIYVPSLTFNQVTGIDLHIIAPVLCIVCTFYTCIGGVKGVIWTDVLQSFIMVGSLLVVIVKGTIDVGGLGVVYQRNWDSGRLSAPDMTIDPTVRMGILAVMVGGTVFKLQGTCISQPAVQRFLSLPNMQAVKRTLIIFTIGLIFLLGLCIYLGLLTFAAYYDCDPISTQLARAKDQVVPLYIMQITGMLPGVPGLFVSGVFSAALSSLSTGLNSMSGVLLKDFIEPYRSKPLTERQTAIALRAVVIIFGLASMAMVHLVEHLGMVMQLSATVGSMATGPTLGIFTIGMMMPFVNTRSVLTGCISSFTVMAYIAIRAQFAIASGELRFPIKPVSTEGCTYEFEARTPSNSTIHESLLQEHSKGMHHISFLWYTMVGAVITISVSLLATLYFGRQDTSDVDHSLVVPWVRRFMKPRRYHSENDALRKLKPTEKEMDDEYSVVETVLGEEILAGREFKLRKLSF